MASTSDIRNGFTFIDNGDLFSIIEFQHVKPGKGAAFVRTKIRNVKTKQVLDRTFRAGEKLEEVRLESRKHEYLYEEGDFFVFMDSQTYDQVRVEKDLIGEAEQYLKENMECDILFFESSPIEVRIPLFVELEVTHTEPGVKGNTAQNALKPATIETGAEVQVPLFIEEGNVIKVDTRTGEYLERVNI